MPQDLLAADGRWGVMEAARWDAFLDWLSGAQQRAGLSGLAGPTNRILLSRLVGWSAGGGAGRASGHRPSMPSVRAESVQAECLCSCAPLDSPILPFAAADKGLLTTKVQSRVIKVRLCLLPRLALLAP